MWKHRHVKYPLFLSDWNKTWILSTMFEKKKLKYQIPSKPAQWEASCSMWTDERTDRHDEANSHFSQFCEKWLKLATVLDLSCGFHGGASEDLSSVIRHSTTWCLSWRFEGRRERGREGRREERKEWRREGRKEGFSSSSDYGTWPFEMSRTN